MSSRPIDFGDRVPWVAVNQREARRIARDPEVSPAAIRVWMAAIGWTNQDGHAEFSQGQLARIVQVCDPKTGEVNPPSKYTLQYAIRAAKQMGLVDPASGARCLVLPRMFAQKSGLGTRGCKRHGLDR